MSGAEDSGGMCRGWHVGHFKILLYAVLNKSHVLILFLAIDGGFF